MDSAPGAFYDLPVNTLIHDVPRQWRCRICGCERYHRVSVLRKNGARYETAFFACNGCTVMFLNDRQFDAAGHPMIVGTVRAGREA